jgi:hypothetical protein
LTDITARHSSSVVFLCELFEDFEPAGRQRDLCAGPTQHPREVPAEAGGGAGDQRGPAGEREQPGWRCL